MIKSYQEILVSSNNLSYHSLMQLPMIGVVNFDFQFYSIKDYIHIFGFGY